ncbi:MAG: peptidylprolyl isomerase [Gemmatimonadetes bacterium]|nr:peptidylprolyl isomerase [Gemmatimonadota bacterium]MDA1104686.1 peptidylprolyl isomerase [Gemmatimonadota bacterium]
MMISRRGLALSSLVLVVGGCAPESDEDLVARVGDYEFTVQAAVDLLVNEERLAADATVVRSLADLWIDYTLLAQSVARDSMFSDLDLSPLVMQQVTQLMVFQLRDSVIQVDTFVTDEELRTRYESEAPAVEVRARHIMLQLPVEASGEQRDSIRAQLERVRGQLLAGASFETLARQFSQDPGSARVGGDLGFFRRGDMVAPFENAALALEPGELSGVVETPMGLHLIRVDERRIRGFAEAASEFRFQVQSRMVAEAESLFVTALVERVNPQLTEGAIEFAREMATNPGSRLSARARRRALLEWEGGAVTAGDVLEVLQIESVSFRSQLNAATDEDIEEFIRGLGRRDLLTREAQASGLQLPRDSVDALVTNAATQLRNASRMLGLLNLDQAPGEKLNVAVTRAVRRALVGNLTGATQVVPLGLVSFQLRAKTSSAVMDRGVGQVILRVGQARATRNLSPIEQALDSALAVPDSARQ